MNFLGPNEEFAKELQELVQSFLGAGIRENAKKHGDRYYAVVEEVCSWQAAKLRCEAIRGQLAVIHSNELNSFLAELIGNPGYWCKCKEPTERCFFTGKRGASRDGYAKSIRRELRLRYSCTVLTIR